MDENTHVDATSLSTEDPLKLVGSKCDECGKTFTSKPSLNTHRYRHKMMKIKSSEAKKRKPASEEKDGKRSKTEANKRGRAPGVKKVGKRGVSLISVSEQNGNTAMEEGNENNPPKEGHLEKILKEVEGIMELG